MKKRIISLLLTVLMVMSLFSGLSVDAYAAQYNGANVIEYTMGQNDYVLRICQSLGLNYYTCKDAIMILNGIQDGQWNKLSVGTDLLLPASDYDAVLIANGARPTTGTTGAAATTATTNNVIATATTGTAANTAASSADVLGYYIVPYTLSYGETVSGVCNSLGVNFSIFGGFIKQLNNVSSWNKVRAGDTIVIPTPYAPSVGTTCYGVMEHIVTNSDTAYGIVTSKGLNYNANERVLKVLNQTDNLASVNAGQKFFYAVPLTVNVPGTGNPGSTATTTTTTTVTDGNGTTTTQTTTTAKLYAITGGMSAADGTMLFYVGSKPVTAASAGTKVTVVTSTNSGKAIQSLTVKHADGSADLRLSGDTFIMPGCDVRVDATVKSGYDINISANYSGKAGASVNGISVQSAVKGAAVVIKSTDPNYEVSAVYASYKKLISASNKTVLAVSSANAFIMPAAAVDVEVVLKPVSTYAFYVSDDPNGSFYLEVNGSPVTRAAKGAKVTVVAKGNDGYEPTSLTVTKHNGVTNVNVFSNTFTMPGYDVDVTVTFGSKGNNILVMPNQLGVVRAYTAIKDASGKVTTEAAKRDPADDVTDAGTGEIVLLKSFVVDDNGVVGAEVDATKYNVTYDVERNSDGLKVNTTKVTDTRYSFVMPKGGVTVSATITTKKTAQVSGLIFLNDSENAETKYSDCNIYLNYKDGNNKDVRAEFSGKAAGPKAVPTLQYVDLRENSEDGISFVRYSIVVNKNATENDKLLSEELTNAANSRGYFQIPDAAATEGKEATIVIKAFFETGKVRINPAVITAGNGTVSFFTRPGFDMPMNFNDIPGAILATLGTSVNSAEPGETVYVIAAPANGYKFDDDKYQIRLKVTRQDNGAALTLTPEGALYDSKTNAIWGYQYSFTMPAAGVDIECAFDAKPFRLYMKCVDETGKDISGLGLWQIAVNMEPGIVDNSMFAEAIGTVVNVEYGDYVTVAMTEAGWSKYDMVSFRIDGKEYTADSLNHFYNFQMIDERAKDLEIVAVMRPRVPYTVGIHNLYAYNYDVTKGGVEFVILDSPTGYSDKERFNSYGALNYVHNAVTGDRVGIVVNTLNGKYTVKPEDISIMTFGDDADRIIPQEAWIDAYGNSVKADTANALHVFSFIMPDSDAYISVNYEGVKQGLLINVVDKNGQPISGMVRLFANGVYRDVGANQSFDDVPFNTPVQIVRSELAYTQNMKIDKVDMTTAKGKSVTYTDMSNAGEGISFMMPDSYTNVFIKMTNADSDLPTFVIDTRVTNGKLVFKKSADINAPSAAITDFKVGDTVYVYGVPNDGYKNLGAGELKVYVNGLNNSANLTPVEINNNKIEGGVGNNISNLWQFKLPAGAIIFEAEFQPKQAAERSITLNITGVDGAKVKATVGDYTGTYVNGSVIKANEGQVVTLGPDTGYTITKIESASGKGINGVTYTVQAGLNDTLSITMDKSSENKTTKVKITTNNTVYITSPAGSGIYSAADSGKEFPLAVGSPITVVPHTDGYNAVRVYDSRGFDQAADSVTYNVPDVGDGGTVDLNILLASTNAPLTINTTTDTKLGVIGLNHEDKPNVLEQVNTFQAGQSFYMFPSPATGYELDLENLSVVENIGGKQHRFQTSSPAETDTLKKDIKKLADGGLVIEDETGIYKIPYGGVTINASFVPKTVKVDFTFSGAKGDVQISNGRVTTIIKDSVAGLDAKFGDTITVTPLNFQWGTNSVTNDKSLTVSGSGATGARSFVINAEGTIKVTLDVAAGTTSSSTTSSSTTSTSTTGGVAKFDSAYDGGSEVADEGGEDLEQQNANQNAEGSGTTDGDEVNLEYPKIEDTENAEGGENVEGAQGAEGGSADGE